MSCTCRETHYFTSAMLNVADGLKTSVATATTPQTYLPAALNGAWLVAGKFLKWMARTVTVTTAAHAGAYNVAAPIVVQGMRGGLAVTESIFLTAANGGETVRGVVAFDSVTEIDVPAMAAATGAFQFGVGDLCGSRGAPLCRQIKPDANGHVRMRFDESGDRDDALPVVLGTVEDVAPLRVLTDPSLSTPTDVGFTIYL